jgi:hypothetical protein
MEKELLLEASGELSPQAREELTAHLAGCERCRRAREELGALARLSGAALKAGEPGPFAMTRIRAAAEARVNRPLTFRVPALQALACAAALALAVGVWFMVAGNGRRDRIGHVNEILAVAAEDVAATDAIGGGDEDAELRALARQLLEMEGLAADDYDEDAWLTPDEAPLPTALQWRNTSASPRKRCA